jgi:hypothetical protein
MGSTLSNRLRAAGCFLIAASCVGVPLFLASGPSGAATTGGTFKLSGAGKGSLASGPVGSCLAGKEGAGIIEIDDLVGAVSNYSNVASWTVVINENKNGTFKIKAASSKDPQVALNPSLKNKNLSQGDKEDLDGTGGTVTVHGSAGSINATVRNLTSSGYGKTLQLTGSWTCPSS